MKNVPETLEATRLVNQIMKKSILTIDSSVPAYEAAKMMEELNVGSLVVAENNVPAGIITDRDFAIKVTAHSYPRDTPIRRIMSSPIISVGPFDTLLVAAELMSSRKLRKLPVIQDERLVGMITATDLIDSIVLNAFKTENPDLQS
jgi:CBS domain-containing protein